MWERKNQKGVERVGGWDQEVEMKSPKMVPQSPCAKWFRNHATVSLKMTAAIFYMVDKFSTKYFKSVVQAHPSNYATLNVLFVFKGLWSEG